MVLWIPKSISSIEFKNLNIFTERTNLTFIILFLHSYLLLLVWWSSWMNWYNLSASDLFYTNFESKNWASVASLFFLIGYGIRQGFSNAFRCKVCAVLGRKFNWEVIFSNVLIERITNNFLVSQVQCNFWLISLIYWSILGPTIQPPIQQIMPFLNWGGSGSIRFWKSLSGICIRRNHSFVWATVDGAWLCFIPKYDRSMAPSVVVSWSSDSKIG